MTSDSYVPDPIRIRIEDSIDLHTFSSRVTVPEAKGPNELWPSDPFHPLGFCLTYFLG
jgi:hypothetical protein